VDFAYTAEDEAFRKELRDWLDANLPEFLDEGEIEDASLGDAKANTVRTMARRRAWQRRLNEGQWAAINWPRDWGGREATIMQNVIYSEEMARSKTPGIFNNLSGVEQLKGLLGSLSDAASKIATAKEKIIAA